MSAIRPEEHTDRPRQHTDRPEQHTDGPGHHADRAEQQTGHPEVQAYRPEAQADRAEQQADRPEVQADRPEEYADEPKEYADEPEHADEPEEHADEPEPRSDRRKQYAEPIVDRIYRAALLVSRGRDDAAELVEETFRRSRAQGISDPGATTLFRILWQAYSERKAPGGSEDMTSAADRELNTHRIESALGHARATVARSFQRLHPEVQTVVLLLEVERMSVGEAAEIVGEPEVEVVRLQEQALSAFHDGLFVEAADWQKGQLIEDLPESWIGDSLAHVVWTLGSAPDELRERLAGVPGTSQGRVIPPVSGPPLEKKVGSSRPVIGSLPIRSLAAAALLILVIGFGAKFVYERLESEPDSNLITILAGAAEEFSADLETDSAERLRRFLSAHVQDETPVPLIEGMRLLGAGLEEIAPEVRIIGLRFVDAATGKPVTVYTLTYRFLDGQETVDLPRDVRRQIQSDADFDLHNLGEKQVVVWRHRAHIFFAVSELDGRELRPRIYFPDSAEQG